MHRSEGNYRGPKEGGFGIGPYDGLNTQGIESKTRSSQWLLATPIPWDPLCSL